LFTGIIREIGSLKSVKRFSWGVTFNVEAPMIAAKTCSGDSICINGVCQTAESAGKKNLEFTAVNETLKKSTLGRMAAGCMLNLESALTPQSTLDGHFVQGHVDGVGRIIAFTGSPQNRILKVKVPPDVYDLTVYKGSIAIDGVSLTVASKKSALAVEVAVIPHTYENTIMKYYRTGGEVNIETDIIGKYVQSYLRKDPGSAGVRFRREE